MEQLRDPIARILGGLLIRLALARAGSVRPGDDERFVRPGAGVGTEVLNPRLVDEARLGAGPPAFREGRGHHAINQEGAKLLHQIQHQGGLTGPYAVEVSHEWVETGVHHG